MKYRLLIAIGILTIITTALIAQVNNRQWGNDNVQTISGTITDNTRPCGFIKADDGKTYKVHMGPIWYWDQNNYALALTNATIKGNLKVVNGENEIYPYVITQDSKTMTFTDDNGIPKWSQGNCTGNGKGNCWKNNNSNCNGRGNGNCCRIGNGNGNGNGWGRGNCQNKNK
jgi:hypothetical protein